MKNQVFFTPGILKQACGFIEEEVILHRIGIDGTKIISIHEAFWVSNFLSCNFETLCCASQSQLFLFCRPTRSQFLSTTSCPSRKCLSGRNMTLKVYTFITYCFHRITRNSNMVRESSLFNKFKSVIRIIILYLLRTLSEREFGECRLPKIPLFHS